MTSDHQAQVEELLAEYRRSRERLADMQKSLAAITESVTSADGLVTARVGAHGTLTELVLVDDAYMRYRPSELAKVIVRTVALATTKASETANRTVSPLLPVRTDPAALLAGTADLRPDELTPEQQPRDDDSFEDRSWLDGRQP